MTNRGWIYVGITGLLVACAVIYYATRGSQGASTATGVAPPAKVYSQQEMEVIRQLQDAETRNKIAIEQQYGK